MIEGKNIHFSPVDSKPLCSFSAKLCKLRRLNGYAFCVRHILEDSSAPFKQCEFVVKSTGQRCSAAIPLDENRTYCHSHMQVLGLLPKKERKRKNHLTESHEEADRELASHGVAHGNLDQSDMQPSVDFSNGSSPALDDLCASPSSADNLSPTSTSEREVSAESLGHAVATSEVSQMKHAADGGAAKDRRLGQAAAVQSKLKMLMTGRSSGSRSRGSGIGRGRGASDLSRRGSKVPTGRSGASRQSPACGEYSNPTAVCASRDDMDNTLAPAARPSSRRVEVAELPSGMFAVLASFRSYAVDVCGSPGRCSDISPSMELSSGGVRMADSPWQKSDMSTFVPNLACTKWNHGTSLTSSSVLQRGDLPNKTHERLEVERRQFIEADASLQRYARLLIACARSSCSATASALMYASGRKHRRPNACVTDISRTATLESPAGTTLSRTTGESISSHVLARGKGSTARTSTLHDDGGPFTVPSLETRATHLTRSPQSHSGKQVRPNKPLILPSKQDLPEQQPEKQLPAAGSSDILTVDDGLLSPTTKAMLDIPLDPVEATDLLDDCEIQQVLNKLPDATFGLFSGKLCS